MFKLIWDFLIVLLIAYSSLFVPYKAAFENSTTQFWFYFDLIIDSIFICDIVLTFNSTYYREQDGLLETSRKQITINYLKGWFFLDLITSIPF